MGLNPGKHEISALALDDAEKLLVVLVKQGFTPDVLFDLFGQDQLLHLSGFGRILVVPSKHCQSGQSILRLLHGWGDVSQSYVQCTPGS